MDTPRGSDKPWGVLKEGAVCAVQGIGTCHRVVVARRCLTFSSSRTAAGTEGKATSAGRKLQRGMRTKSMATKKSNTPKWVVHKEHLDEARAVVRGPG